MDFCKHYLGKSIDEVLLRDLEEFFQEEQSESDKIEFKSFTVDKRKPRSDKDRIKDIQAEITAFLNTDGGLLIWGAPVEDENKICKGELTKVGIKGKLEEDRLTRMLTDNIDPLPARVIIKVIEKSVVLIEVHKSESAPHQSSNGVYYIRVGEQVKKAPHRYLEALIKQVKFPNIEGYLLVDDVRRANEVKGAIEYVEGLSSRDICLEIRAILINFSPFIVEEDLSFRFFTKHGKSIEYFKEGSLDFLEIYDEGREIRCFNFKKTFHNGEPVTFFITLIYNENDLKTGELKDSLSLVFNGRKSPLKSSNYNLSFENYIKNNGEVSVIDKGENLLYADEVVKEGKTKEQVLNEIFKRQPSTS